MVDAKINTLATVITEKGYRIGYSQNSVLNALGEYSSGDEFNEVAGLIAGKVTNEIAIYRNTMQPIYKGIINFVEDKLKERKIVTPYDRYQLEIVRLPELFKVFEERNALNVEESTQLSLTPINVPIPSKENIKSVFKTGLSSIDDAAVEVLGTVTDEELLVIFNKYFINISTTNTNISSISTTIAKYDYKTLAILLLGTFAFKNKVPEDVTITAEAFKRELDIYHKLICKTVASAIKAYSIINNNDTLILAIKEGKVFVNYLTFEKFTKEGNSIDIIYGMAATSETAQMVSKTDVIAKAPGYIAKWKTVLSLDKFAKTAEDRKANILLYELAIRDVYSKLTDDAKELLGEIQLTDTLNDFSVYVEKVESDKLCNVERVSAYIVGCLMYPNTNWYKFNKYINKYLNMSDDLDASEAAAMATVNLVYDWLIDQMTVVKV